MMTAEDQWNVFQGVKRRGNTLAVLSERATPKKIPLVTAPRGCEDTYSQPQGVLGLLTESEGDCVGFAVLAPPLLRIRYGSPPCNDFIGPGTRALHEPITPLAPYGAARSSQSYLLLEVSYRNSLTAIKSAFP